MAIQMLRRNPTIETFQTGMQTAAAARAAEEEEFRRRFQLERELGADKALRTGIANFYTPATPVEPSGSGITPTPAAPGVVALTAPQPAPGMEGAAGTGISPVAAENGAVGGLGTGLKAGVSTSETYPTPSAAPAAPATATPRAGAPAAPGMRYGGIQSELAKQAGTGQAMLNLFTRDEADRASRETAARTLRAEGEKLMLQALKDGDIPMARAYAQRYGLEVPEEVWKNRDVLLNLRTAAGLAKQLGIKDDHAVAFSQGYMEARTAGQSEDQAMLAGLKLVPRGGFEVKGHFVDEKGNVVYYDKAGQEKPSGRKARPLAGRGTGPGGGSTATIMNREDMKRRLKVAYPGIDDQLAEKLVINPRATITPQDVIKQRNALQNMKDSLGRPLYKTSQELDNAVRQVLAGAREMAGFAATSSVGPGGEPAAPTPAAPPAGGGPKRLKFNPSTVELEELK